MSSLTNSSAVTPGCQSQNSPSNGARKRRASEYGAATRMKMLRFRRHHGLARFVSIQSRYSLVCRDDERDMLPSVTLTNTVIAFNRFPVAGTPSWHCSERRP